MRTILDKIIVKLPEGPTKSSGGIIIPDSAMEKPYQGVVETSSVKGVHSSDVVLFKKTAGVPFEKDGEQYLCITEQDVLVIL